MKHVTPTLHLLTLCLSCLLLTLPGYGQTAGPGCTTPYYKGNYGPPLDGSVALKSSAVGPDGCIYIGSTDYPVYSIIKLDSFGSIIRTTSYTPPAILNYSPGKTILDADGNLFSVICNNYILRTDTLGNVLSSRQLSFIGPETFSFLDVGVLSNGDKVFLLSAPLGGAQDVFLVATTPDASAIRWTRYLTGNTYLYSNAAMLADGDKIILGVDFYGSNYYPNGSGILELDGGTGAVLGNEWVSQILNFSQISRYNNGYIFNGRTNDANFPSFYLRTNSQLNVLSAHYFPAYTTGYPYGYPFLFQPQADGSVYGFYSSTGPMTLFLISPEDVIQWASGLFGFYQDPITLTLGPAGIYIGTDYSATDVITGGPLSGIQLYKSSYSGYFPPCTNPSAATMSMSAYPLTAILQVLPCFDTSAFTLLGASIQQTTGPPLVGNTCTGSPGCNSLKITGNPTVCTGNGAFVGNLNSGCSVPLSWSVTDGPGTGAITINNNNAVSISFDKDGAYKVKAAFSANCTIYADSVVVHVTTTATHLSLGNDTTLCAGASLLLRAGTNFNSYAWQDGAADSNYLVTTQGQYSVTAQDFCGNAYNSSVNVSYRPPLVSPYPAALAKCLTDTLGLALPPGFDSVYFVVPAADARIRHDSVQFFNAGTSSYTLGEIDGYGCRVNSGVTVQIYPQPVLDIGGDRTICPGDSVRLDPGAGLDNYLWSTGSQSEAIWASAGGTYSVQTTTTDGCIARAAMTLANYPAPVVNLDADTVLCAGATRQLFAGDGFTSYLWNDGSSASSLIVRSTGQYWVDVTDTKGCSTADTVIIKAIVALPANFLPDDTTICQYGGKTLIPNAKFTSYLWSDGSTNPSLTVQTPGSYYLQVVDKNGCTGKDTISLTGEQCLIGCYVPNAFTPNHDGKNDVFRPLIYGDVVQYRFAVFNRWGQQVFESTQPSNGWDGTINGVPQPANTFVWYCIFQLQGQEVQTQRGSMLLIR